MWGGGGCVCVCVCFGLIEREYGQRSCKQLYSTYISISFLISWLVYRILDQLIVTFLDFVNNNL